MKTVLAKAYAQMLQTLSILTLAKLQKNQHHLVTRRLMISLVQVYTY